MPRPVVYIGCEPLCDVRFIAVATTAKMVRYCFFRVTGVSLPGLAADPVSQQSLRVDIYSLGQLNKFVEVCRA